MPYSECNCSGLLRKRDGDYIHCLDCWVMKKAAGVKQGRGFGSRILQVYLSKSIWTIESPYPLLLLPSPSQSLTHNPYIPVPTPTATKLPTANHLKSPCWCHTAAATQWPKLTQLTTAISVPPKLERWEAGTRVCVSWVAERS